MYLSGIKESIMYNTHVAIAECKEYLEVRFMKLVGGDSRVQRLEVRTADLEFQVHVHVLQLKYNTDYIVYVLHLKCNSAYIYILAIKRHY